jgi:acetolactate synthase II small subunit
MTTLSLLLQRHEGALLRVLGTVQRRGFEIAAVRTHAHESDHALWRIEIEVNAAGRDPAVLERQLRRLVDVVAIGDDVPA